MSFGPDGLDLRLPLPALPGRAPTPAPGPGVDLRVGLPPPAPPPPTIAPPPVTPAPRPPTRPIDLEALAEAVQRRLARRGAWERERRGGGQ
jgi:hypothetical protein